MSLRFEHILSFIKVVECGSFTTAAQLLTTSKSVISKHISALEDCLSTQLLKRHSRRVQPTEVGLEYYHQVKTIPEQLTNAQDKLLQMDARPMGVLKILAPINFSYSLRLEVIPEFLRAYPEVTLECRFERPVENYLHEDFDVVLMWKFDFLPFPDYPLIAKHIFTMPTGLYATPKYLDKYGEPQTLNDLPSHHCLSSISQPWPFKDVQGDITYQHTSGRLLTNNDDIIHGVVHRDMAIAYSYPFMYANSLRSGEVVSIMKPFTHLAIEGYVLYRPSRFIPLKINRFIETLETYYQRTQNEIAQLGNL